MVGHDRTGVSRSSFPTVPVASASLRLPGLMARSRPVSACEAVPVVGRGKPVSHREAVTGLLRASQAVSSRPAA